MNLLLFATPLAVDENPEATCTNEKPSEDEQKLLDTWLAAHELNDYGYDKSAGAEAVTSGQCGPFESVLFLYPDRPWQPFETSGVCSQYEQKQIEAWAKKNGRNQYGDPEGTAYLGGSALFMEDTGESITICEKVRRNFPATPWLSENVSLEELQSEAKTSGGSMRGRDAAGGGMDV